MNPVLFDQLRCNPIHFTNLHVRCQACSFHSILQAHFRIVAGRSGGRTRWMTSSPLSVSPVRCPGLPDICVMSTGGLKWHAMMGS